MKKLMAMFLCIMLVIFAASCGEDEKEKDNDKKPSESTEMKDDSKTPDPGENDPGTSAPDGKTEDKTEDKTDDKQEEKPVDDGSIALQTLLCEVNGIRITADKFRITDKAVIVDVTVENKSEGRYSVNSQELLHACNSINGYMVDDGYLSTEENVNFYINAGETISGFIKFDLNQLKLRGITEIADMELSFSFTNEKYKTSYSGPCKITLKDGFDYSASTYNTTVKDAEKMKELGYETVIYYNEGVVYENGGIELVSQAYVRSSEKDVLLLEFVNKTDKIMSITLSDLCANGLKLTTGSCDNVQINPGKKAIATIVISDFISEDIKKLVGITDIATFGIDISKDELSKYTFEPSQTIEIKLTDAEPTFKASDSVVYDKNGIKVTYQGIKEGNYDTLVYLLLDNTTDLNIDIDIQDDSLYIDERITTHRFNSQYVDKGMALLAVLYLDNDSMKNNGIEAIDIRDINLKLVIEEYTKTLSDTADVVIKVK